MVRILLISSILITTLAEELSKTIEQIKRQENAKMIPAKDANVACKEKKYEKK